MNNFTLCKRFVVFLMAVVVSNHLSAQSVVASPPNILKPIAGNSVPVTVTPSGFGGAGNYTWTVNGGATATGLTGFSTTSTAGTPAQALTFTSAASGTYTFTVTRNGATRSVTVTLCNIIASVANDSTDNNKGQWAGGFLANLGALEPTANGQRNIFDYNLNQRVSAIAVNASGFVYYIENIGNNNGSVTVTGSNANGTVRNTIGSIDINGAGGADLGFVRLGVDITGVCWILASDGNTVYLAKFTTNGTSAATISIVSANVPFAANSGTAAMFQNGDLAFTANGTMYVLANDGAATPTSTAIYVLDPNAVTPTLSRRFFVLNNSNAPFTGTVNGTAFDLPGNLYISSADGLYFINQNTVNNGAGTVNATLVHAIQGLTDLGSNFWPLNSSLPVDLLSFGGTYSNQSTKLNWVAENVQNFKQFEVERSTDGKDFVTIGTKSPQGNGASKEQYLFTDDLSQAAGSVFYYRLKMVDVNGSFKYSNVILVRKGEQALRSLVVSPNPLTKGSVATVRYTAAARSNIDLSVLDLSGKLLLRQQNSIFEGTNSITINNAERLLPGTYILQVKDNGANMTTKFSILR